MNGRGKNDWECVWIKLFLASFVCPNPVLFPAGFSLSFSLPAAHARILFLLSVRV